MDFDIVPVSVIDVEHNSDSSTNERSSRTLFGAQGLGAAASALFTEVGSQLLRSLWPPGRRGGLRTLGQYLGIDIAIKEIHSSTQYDVSDLRRHH